MIHSLTEEEQENLPTNNLNCERHLAKFGRIAAESAAHSNKFFTGKRIRDDIMFDGRSSDLNFTEFNINLINIRTFPQWVGSAIGTWHWNEIIVILRSKYDLEVIDFFLLSYYVVI